MKPVSLHNKDEIEAVLRGDVFLHIYSIGDLDEFFWPYTTWYGLKDGEDIRAVVLVYTGGSVPTLLALTEEDKVAPMQELLSQLVSVLPRSFYAHLSPGLEEILREQYALHTHGEHYKMALTNTSLLAGVDTSRTAPLSISDLNGILRLFSEAYPGNWFEPRMLETHQYYGIWGTDGLISVAGVHVYSPRYRVAALGNITTHPRFRGQGYATTVTARLCTSLLRHVDHIGLNVKTDNTSAIRCYEKLGFEIVGSYSEYEVEARSLQNEQ